MLSSLRLFKLMNASRSKISNRQSVSSLSATYSSLPSITSFRIFHVEHDKYTAASAVLRSRFATAPVRVCSLPAPVFLFMLATAVPTDTVVIQQLQVTCSQRSEALRRIQYPLCSPNWADILPLTGCNGEPARDCGLSVEAAKREGDGKAPTNSRSVYERALVVD